MPGVLDSHVGYTGGDTVDPPTYRSVCRNDGHTEAIRLEFDPTVLSFEELMRTFFEDPHVAGYYPGASAEKPQYMSAVFAQDEAQEATARHVSTEVGKEVPIIRTREWHDAEEYHQFFLAPALRPAEGVAAE